MDLDSHAIKSLQPILDYEGDLVMFPTGIPERKKARLEMQGWGVRYQAATMLFYPGTDCMKKVWDTFLKNPDGWMKKYRSDQDVMGKWIPDQPMFPREWMCKLDSIRKNPKWWEEPPEDVIIVTGQTPDGFFRATDTIPWFEQTAR